MIKTIKTAPSRCSSLTNKVEHHIIIRCVKNSKPNIRFAHLLIHPSDDVVLEQTLAHTNVTFSGIKKAAKFRKISLRVTQ
jgi:hypothetical protein